MLDIKKQVRDVLAAAGANEVLTYSFVHGDLLDKTGQKPSQAFQLANALSPDLQYFRLSLTPSILSLVHPNIKNGYGDFALFEINKIHVKSEVAADGLPEEFSRVALVFAADDKTASTKYAGAPFYQARMYLMHLLTNLGLASQVQFVPLTNSNLASHAMIEQMTQPFEPNRSALVLHEGAVVGVVGEYRARVAHALKLPNFASGFEIFARALIGSTSSYVQLPRFPKVDQDICLKVSADLPYEELFQFVWNHLQENRPDATYHSLGPVDIYQREGDTEHKQITLRLSIASYERTLTDQEVSQLLDRVAQAAKEKFQAERI
jgi:phenylalanyl-tRNA synthetase beta chain